MGLYLWRGADDRLITARATRLRRQGSVACAWKAFDLSSIGKTIVRYVPGAGDGPDPRYATIYSNESTGAAKMIASPP